MNAVTKEVIDYNVHARLLADIDSILSVAGVQEKYVKESMTKYCSVDEFNWVKNFKKLRAEGMPGLILEKVNNPDSRMQAIAGALLRNFIDARVIPIGTILDLQEDGNVPSPTVLLIPNFYLSISGKTTTTGWKVQIMYDILLQRASQGKPSVLYIQDKELMAKAFGKVLTNFLNSFQWVSE